MKKTYETPSIEVVKFQYRDQVVVASGANPSCVSKWENEGLTGCPKDEQIWVEHLN